MADIAELASSTSSKITFWQPVSKFEIAISTELVAPVGPRDYVVCVEVARHGQTISVHNPGWYYSKALNVDFCYLPPIQTTSLVRLPKLSFDENIGTVQISVRKWSSEAEDANSIVREIWAYVDDIHAGAVRTYKAI